MSKTDLNQIIFALSAGKNDSASNKVEELASLINELGLELV